MGKPECKSRIYSRHMYLVNHTDFDIPLNENTNWDEVETWFSTEDGRSIQETYKAIQKEMLEMVEPFEMALLEGNPWPLDLEEIHHVDLSSNGLKIL